MYTAAAAAANSPSMSSSIASLRLKAKQYDDQLQSPSSYSSIPSLTSNDNKVGSSGNGGDTPDPPQTPDSLTSAQQQHCQYGLSDKTGASAAALVGQ
jgi:hypothetical protein